MDSLPSPVTCPTCGVLLRDGADGLVCPEHGLIEPYDDVELPREFDGPEL